MFTLGRYPTKYVYPTLFFLLLLLFFLARHAAAEERGQNTGTGRVETIQERNDIARRHSEREFIHALDSFNERAASEYAWDDMRRGEALDRRADLVQMVPYGGGRYSTPYGRDVNRYMSNYVRGGIDRYGNRYSDLRYGEERRRLDTMRGDEYRSYRESRDDIERRMSGYSRNDPEYNRLQEQLFHLDRRHAERERDFENRFKSMDVEHSITRW